MARVWQKYKIVYQKDAFPLSVLIQKQATKVTTDYMIES